MFDSRKTPQKVKLLRESLNCTIRRSLLFLLSVACASAYGQANENLVESIMNMRSEVERLHADLQDAREDHRATMRSYATQTADLDAQINRQEIALRQLGVEKQKVQDELEHARASTDSFKPLLLDAVGRLRNIVAVGMPFKLPERLADLDVLRDNIESEAVSEERALGQLWSAYEDVFRISQENGIFRQEILLDGSPMLADVAKIGSVLLFFRTLDGEFGETVRGSGGSGSEPFRFQRIDDARRQQQVADLFDALEKQIRTGYFSLPGSLLVDREG